MPVPKPRKNEPKDKFIQRCMANANMQEYAATQRAGICFSQWKEHGGKKNENEDKQD